MLIPPMILVLWLVSYISTSQQKQVFKCISSSGDLPAPELFRDKSSASDGDIVLYRCLIPSNISVSFAFLCKDGKEMTRKPTVLGKRSYDFPHHVSQQSSGNFSCGYQYNGLHNQVKSSHLSIAHYLHVTDKLTNSSSQDPETTSPHGLKMILGITVPTILGLCVVLFLLIIKVAHRYEKKREQNPNESTNTAAAGKLMDASSVGCSNSIGLTGKDKDIENYESLNPTALEINPYSTLHVEQKSKPAVSTSQLSAPSLGCFNEMESEEKEVAGEGYEQLDPNSVQKALYSTLPRVQ